jgi:hypothetical protein
MAANNEQAPAFFETHGYATLLRMGARQGACHDEAPSPIKLR